ncbi:MAG TPA: Mth938-like domain-containing protein [Burkholderiales bacterium]
MKFHITAPGALNYFSAYGEGFVRVGERRYEQNLIVTPDRVLPWAAASFEALSEADFEPLLVAEVDILLLGTGAKQRFPHPRLTRALAAKRIGVEAMDLQAACRTFNILVVEERRVAAALLFA